MSIALIAVPKLPFLPKLYGSIKRGIDLPALDLGRRRDQDTLFAHPESTTNGQIIPWPGTSQRFSLPLASEWRSAFAGSCLEARLLSSFFFQSRLPSSAFLSPIPKLIS